MGTHQGFPARQGGRLRRDGEGQPSVFEAVLWIARTGSPWRDLPDEFGYWHRVYVRYSQWGKKGVWAQLLSSVSDVPDLEYLMVDGSIVRVHQHGAAKKQPRPRGDGQVAGRVEHQDTRRR